MKPKTITQILTQLLSDFGIKAWDEDYLSIEPALAQIQQLLEECAPIKRTVIKDESLTSAGEQIRYRSLGFNQAIDQYKSNLREKLR